MVRLQKRIDFADKKLQNIQSIRFLSGLFFFVAFIASGFLKSGSLVMASLFYWLLVFPFLVRTVKKVAVYKHMLEAKKYFLLRQELKKNGKILSTFNGKTSEEARELLLVGPYSLYSYLDETWTLEAQAKLKKNIESPSQDLNEILSHQGNIRELYKYSHTLEKLLFRHTATDSQKISLEKVETEIQNLPKKSFLTWAYISLTLWVLSLVATVLASYNVIDSAFLNIWFLYFGILIIAYNKYGSFFYKSLSLYSSLRILKHLLKVLEKNSNPVFEKILPHTTKTKPQRDFKKLEFVMSFLSVETHILVNLVVNLLSPYYFLFGALFVYRATKIKSNFSLFKEEIINLDYLSNFVYLYTYHSKVFPVFHPQLSIKAVQVFIPLIPHHKVQKNSIELSANQSLHVLMGSNMSGKSTFLRTLAVNQTLAQLGATVFAEKYETFVARLESCILIEDSIEDSISYFMKEVKRLKKVFFNVKAQNNTLFLIDELFKGTNPKERLIAARSYLSEIAKFKGVGVITTHDPEIGFLEKENKHFKSWHMEEHTLKEGPAVSTNALKILKSEGLPVYED